MRGLCLSERFECNLEKTNCIVTQLYVVINFATCQNVLSLVLSLTSITPREKFYS